MAALNGVDPEEEAATMQGVLWKRKRSKGLLGELLRPWQRRFFVLQGGRLAWFVDGKRGKDRTVRRLYHHNAWPAFQVPLDKKILHKQVTTLE